MRTLYNFHLKMNLNRAKNICIPRKGPLKKKDGNGRLRKGSVWIRSIPDPNPTFQIIPEPDPAPDLSPAPEPGPKNRSRKNDLIRLQLQRYGYSNTFLCGGFDLLHIFMWKTLDPIPETEKNCSKFGCDQPTKFQIRNHKHWKEDAKRARIIIELRNRGKVERKEYGKERNNLKRKGWKKRKSVGPNKRPVRGRKNQFI